MKSATVTAIVSEDAGSAVDGVPAVESVVGAEHPTRTVRSTAAGRSARVRIGSFS
jgi:hypothetical protein